MEVSVIIPVYNAVDFLDQSIQSALDQPEVREVITIDDGSTDGSYEKLVDWERKEERVKLLTHPGRQRKRAAATRNLGLKAANAEFIAFLDADDYYLPNRFGKTKRTLSENPDANVIYEAVEIIKDEGSPLPLPKDHILMMDDVDENRIFEYCLTSQKGHISPDGVTIRRNLSDEIGLMDENLPQKEDKDYILRLCLHGNIKRGVGGRKPVAVYRYHSNNSILDFKERQKYVFQLHKKWLKKLNGLPLTYCAKLIFIRQYMVSKYDSISWSLAKKLAVYPFLYLIVAISNFHVFKPPHNSNEL